MTPRMTLQILADVFERHKDAANKWGWVTVVADGYTLSTNGTAWTCRAPRAWRKAYDRAVKGGAA